MRIGVLYDDGSLNIMSDRDGSEIAETRARTEAHRWNTQPRPKGVAVVVSIDLEAGDIVEITDGRL